MVNEENKKRLYNQYRISYSNGIRYISFCSPYDEQNYYYAIDNKICRDGKFIEKTKFATIDEIIYKLIELNSTLPSRMCHN